MGVSEYFKAYVLKPQTLVNNRLYIELISRGV
jgi:hypothetical protein